VEKSRRDDTAAPNMEVRKLDVGTLVAGKYRLQERLGGGGMGEVFRATHELAGRVVALKLLRHDYAGDADLTRRFFQEAQAVNKIRHPNIVDVFDAGLAEQGPYVAMEYLEGASLAQALSRVGRVNLPTALAVVLPMLDALDGAHRHGIVHRDLKPENVFLVIVGDDVRVKLLDFGIAKVLDQPGTSPRTNTGVIFGTPDYLSPEQASGEGTLDGRSDVFAVGTVLFELLTGKRPFEAPTAVATAYRIVHAAPPTLLSLGISIPPRVQEVLDIALTKRPEDRYQTAAAFADSLAPLVPDAGARRRALRALLDAVSAQPTLAANDLAKLQPPRAGDAAGPSMSFEPSLPAAPSEDLPSSQGWDLAASSLDESSRPAVVPAARGSAPKLGVPAGPTMVSNAYVTPPAKASPLREPIVTPPQPPVAERSSPQISGIPTPGRSSPALTPRFDVRDSELQRALSSRQSQSDRSTNPDSSGGRRAISATDRTTPVEWAPRPLPVSARGRLHTRGTLPRALFKWVERTHGATGRDAVLALLPEELADTYRGDGFNALVWYDLEATDTLLEATTFTLLRRDPAGWQRMARENFDKDLAPIFRPTAQRTDTQTLLRRLPGGWGRVLDFGNPRIGESKSGGTLVKIDGFEGASLALRHVIMGTIEGLLHASMVPCTLRVLAGEASFVRDFEIEIAAGK
jgi:serine/threonine protein kinase